MKPHGNHLLSVFAIGALALFLSACGKPEGPAEKAGKEVDKAVQSAGEKNRTSRGENSGCSKRRKQVRRRRV